MKDIVSFLYIFITFILFLYGIHFFVILILFHRKKKKGKVWKKKENYTEEELPVVTVQLPVFNEWNVVERLIDAAVHIKYPKEKLEIQVLDDSTDESRFLTERIVKNYAAQGYNIHYIHRTNREGFKAGALKAGLEKASGELIAIFDADFIPNENFLIETVPFFLNHKEIGLVQTRWDYYNKDYSFLTQIQAIELDGHFMVEQKARSDNGLWFNFNGTAGIWRKECIYDAGNWEGDTLTEDLDLSYRAQIKGWSMVYYREIGHLSELPVTMPAFKSQQFRWAKGAFQCGKKLLKKIITADAPLANKIEAITHLVNYGAFIFIALNFFLMLPLCMIAVAYKTNPWKIIPWYWAILLFLVGLLSPIAYFIKSQKERNIFGFSTIKSIIGLIVLNFGLSFMIIKAFIEAMTGKVSSFVRTPKFNLKNKTEIKQKDIKYYKLKIDGVTLFEIIGGILGLFTVSYAFHYKIYGIGFFAALYTIGFFWVSISTIQTNFFIWKKNRLKLKQGETNV